MKFISVRDLRVQPGEVWQQLREETELVLTSSGRPIALLVDVGDSDVAELLTALRQVRAQQAVARMRKHAAAQGLATLSNAEIDAEIAAARAARAR